MSAANPTIWKKIRALNGEEIVLFNWEGQPPTFANLARMSKDGRTIWTVQPPHPLEGVYSYARFEAGVLMAYNMAGYDETIDYETGRVIRRKFVK